MIISPWSKGAGCEADVGDVGHKEAFRPFSKIQINFVAGVFGLTMEKTVSTTA